MEKPGQGKNEHETGLKLPVRFLPGVGPQRSRLLARLGISTVEDLLFHLPARYEDRRRIVSIADAVPGQQVTICGRVLGVEESRPRPNLTVLKALISDGSGRAYGVWFNQGYLRKSLLEGTEWLITGTLRQQFFQKEIRVTDFEPFAGGTDRIHSGRIVPVYPLTAGLSLRFLRKLIYHALEQYAPLVPDVLPAELRSGFQPGAFSQALCGVHFPKDPQEAEQCRKRLAYEELLLVQLRLLSGKMLIRQKKGIRHEKTGRLVKRYWAALDFSLTPSQKKAVRDIFRDMEQEWAMTRLLQGDVGSGKTVVATFALLKALDNGFQGVLMAPTEILAEQHFLNLKAKLEPLGIKMALLTGSLNEEEKKEMRLSLSRGEIELVIGTHALLQENINFAKLGLVVIDEQHKFGVTQRAVLLEKGKRAPDLLVMTATPIPRTLALTFYGDLDFSVINELPPGRRPVLTRYVPESKREQAYGFIKKQLDQGRQVYIVCPLVEDSEKIEAEAALQMAEELRKGYFRSYRIGTVYGKMPPGQKEKVMEDFRRHQLDILVATSVVEVGVDVPNASVMLINGCERFGLAQLHQLRGRIGRGPYQSYCLLMGRPKTREGKRRIKIMISTDNGFQLAEEDLKLRGPGDFFGVRQHGLPSFKAANLLTDYQLLEAAREAAREIGEKAHLPQYRELIEIAQKKFGDFHP
ncbi:MAG: ATP-dependent DNA helicase RecG [Clostridia bacterium]|nr:ATP-dependent DNA helicase RecG [Clostridia bacterium]